MLTILELIGAYAVIASAVAIAIGVLIRRAYTPAEKAEQ